MKDSQTRIVSILTIFILWQALSIAIDSDVLPSVIDVIKSMYFHIFEGELLSHLLITLTRVLITFIIAMFMGVVFGILMGLYKKVNSFFDTLLIIGLNVPALVTIILCYIWNIKGNKYLFMM